MSNDLARRRLMLGKDEKWIEDILGEYCGSRLPATFCVLSRIDRRKAAEEELNCWYSPDEIKKFQEVYDNALSELELIGNGNMPACPDGVTVEQGGNHWKVLLNGVHCCSVLSGMYPYEDRIVPHQRGQHWPPRLARFVADLSEYVTYKQRKLDAVKVAQKELSEACEGLRHAKMLLEGAQAVYDAACREASL